MSHKRRRIALAMEFPLIQQGGTEVLVQSLLRGLSDHFDIVLVSDDKAACDLPVEYSRMICGHVTWKFGVPSPQQARALASRLRRENIELAHFNFGGTFHWGSNRHWRCPVYHLAGNGITCLTTNHLASEWLNCGVSRDRPRWQQHLGQIFAILSRSLLYRRLKLEVCVSQHDHARLLKMFPLFRHKIIQRYHSLLPADAPPPGMLDREPVVLCVGTFGERKAQTNLVEAFGRIAPRHPRWRLELIGRPVKADFSERLRARIARSGCAERIALPGRLGDDETLARMKRASIFAMPSLQEGLGLSLQEALYHGCVGVGSRVGGIPELIDHEVNGLLVPPGDVAALAAALDRLMSDPALVESFRAQTRPSILRKGMTAGAMVKTYLELYDKCLATSA